MPKENKKAHYCEYCHHYATQQDPNNPVTFTADPFDSDLYGDHTEHWLRNKCVGERGEEI